MEMEMETMHTLALGFVCGVIASIVLTLFVYLFKKED
jgi:hypothetical protein